MRLSRFLIGICCMLQVFIFPGVGFGAVMVKAKEVNS